MASLYFRQLLSGRDFCRDNLAARQMRNFVYAIGDRDAGQAVLVDPTYDVAGLLDVLAADEMDCVGALATHHHPDHVGGSLFGESLEGVRELLELAPVPIHVNEAERTWVERTTGTSAELVGHDSGDVVSVGEIEIELIHTPGHTPGSQCFLVADRLVAGDTLFLEGCGRTDLPGGDPEELYHSIHSRLARVPDTATLFPGHWYSMEPSGSMGETRHMNYVFRAGSLESWMTMFS